MKDRVTPDLILRLRDNEIFVFGSNMRGMHGAGAAHTAWKKFGAIMGKGEGLYGDSYALPTKDRNIITLPIDKIAPKVNRLIRFAKKHPELTFLVTEVGCGLAGYKCKDIAPLFKDAIPIKNIYLPQNFWIYLTKIGTNGRTRRRSTAR